MVVVGAGAIGAAAAYELARAGARVTVLERGGEGCSHGNAGLICPSHAESLANLAAVRDGLRWLGRRDSPFHLRLRPPLLPWLARFGRAALPGRSRRRRARCRRWPPRRWPATPSSPTRCRRRSPPRHPQRVRDRRAAGGAERPH